MKRRKVEQVFVDVARHRRSRLELFFIPVLADIIDDYVGFFKGEVVSVLQSDAPIAVTSQGERMTATHSGLDFGLVTVAEQQVCNRMQHPR